MRAPSDPPMPDGEIHEDAHEQAGSRNRIAVVAAQGRLPRGGGGGAGAEHGQSIADVAGEVPDTGDASVAMLVTDIEHTMAERHVNELHAIDRALAQLHERTFGLCSDCEGEIGYARLKASPTATRCTACQTIRERTYAHEGTPTL